MQAWSVVKFAQVAQHFRMLSKRTVKRIIGIIRKVVLDGRFLHDFCNLTVMNVADIWEQMVLHLVIQTTYIP